MPERVTTIERLAAHWRVALPAPFSNLYAARREPVAGSCELAPIEALLEDELRWRGIYPRLLPFGSDGEGAVFALLAADGLPVMRWTEDADHCVPVASSFAAFLGWCRLTAAYERQDAAPDAAEPSDDAAPVGGPLPRTERELNEALVRADPLAPHALAVLACDVLRRGDAGGAASLTARAASAAPWFGDAWFLRGHVGATTGHAAEAAASWLLALRCPIALTSSTGAYGLDADGDDVQIPEAVVDGLRAMSGALPTGDPLVALALGEHPFSVGTRLALALALEAAGDIGGAERETHNALALATDDSALDHAYDALIDLLRRTGRPHDAERCRRDAELA
ncbi:MAG: SMI1/KNR4 family protein [Chthonomonadales bacterium]|nr:SMI1/KNR4 family protein [Chthonomonadales bacterium]